MAAKGLPKDPTDPTRYTRYIGKREFEQLYMSDWKGLTQDQVMVLKNVWPNMVDADSIVTVEALSDGRRKLTFSKANVLIVCDPRESTLQNQAREQLIGVGVKPLGLTRSPYRNTVARIAMRLRHFGYM